MESYKRGSHTVWDCEYHVVWVTKYRYPVLGSDVGQRCRELLRETARAHEMVAHAWSINRDHVHIFPSIPPSLSVSRAVQYLKGRSSHKLLAEFASLRKRYWGPAPVGAGLLHDKFPTGPAPVATAALPSLTDTPWAQAWTVKVCQVRT